MPTAFIHKWYKPFLALLLTAVSFIDGYAQINVTPNQTAAQLVQKLLGNGITYSNAVLTCHTDGSGTFDVVSSNLGLPGGVVLTSGKAATDANGAGMNAAEIMSSENMNPGPGDPDLDQLSTFSTNDACVLEFDFVPDGDTLLFNYVFGSEEYDAFSCTQYNDVFAFFLSGPSLPATVNLAKIPNTNIPVTVNSTTDPAITMPFSLAMCQAMGPGSPFAQYYQDNRNGQTVSYYGFTKVLTAKSPVDPCQTYHIKLAIADASDGALSSGVMIEENSFRSSPVTLSMDAFLGTNYPFLVEDCAPGTVKAKRNKALPTPQVVHLKYAGTAVRNVDYFNVPDSLIIPANDTVASFLLAPIQDNLLEGTETIEVQVINKCNGMPLQTMTVEVKDYLPVQLLTRDTNVCEKAPVKLEMSYDPNFTYSWTANNNTPIDNPSSHLTWAYPAVTTTFTGQAFMNGCKSQEYKVTIGMEPTPKVNILVSDTLVCLRDSMKIEVLVTPENFSGFIYDWYPFMHLGSTTTKETKFFDDLYGDHKYILTVTTPLGCTGSDSITIHSRPPVNLYDVTANSVVKYGNTIQLNASGANYYVWTPTRFLNNPNIANPIAKPTEPENLRVIGMNVYGCQDTAYVKLNIDYNMGEFIPNAFSPDGDGLNEVFRPVGIIFQKVMEFRVFNRWGEELFSTQEVDKGWDGTYKGKPQENGTYFYLIRAVLPNAEVRTYKGDVMLIR